MSTTKKQCRMTKDNGETCKAAASENGFCFLHDPARAQERAVARRKGGLTRLAPSPADKSLVPDKVRSMPDVIAVLNYALHETLALSNSIQRGRLLVSIAHGYVEALKVGELEQRLEAVEHTLQLRREADKDKNAKR